MTIGTVRCAKLQLNGHHQQTNTQLFTGWVPFLSHNQQCQSIEGKKHHIPQTCSPQAHLRSDLVFNHYKASGYFWEGLSSISSAL